MRCGSSTPPPPITSPPQAPPPRYAWNGPMSAPSALLHSHPRWDGRGSQRCRGGPVGRGARIPPPPPPPSPPGRHCRWQAALLEAAASAGCSLPTGAASSGAVPSPPRPLSRRSPALFAPLHSRAAFFPAPAVSYLRLSVPVPSAALPAPPPLPYLCPTWLLRPPTPASAGARGTRRRPGRAERDPSGELSGGTHPLQPCPSPPPPLVPSPSS